MFEPELFYTSKFSHGTCVTTSGIRASKIGITRLFFFLFFLFFFSFFFLFFDNSNTYMGLKDIIALRCLCFMNPFFPFHLVFNLTYICIFDIPGFTCLSFQIFLFLPSKPCLNLSFLSLREDPFLTGFNPKGITSSNQISSAATPPAQIYTVADLDPCHHRTNDSACSPPESRESGRMHVGNSIHGQPF